MAIATSSSRPPTLAASAAASAAATVGALGLDQVLEQPAPRRRAVFAHRAEFDLDGLPHEVRRVQLPVRMRVRDADELALVLEQEHVAHVRVGRELTHLRLPDAHDGLDRIDAHLRERQVVSRREADHARDAVRARRAMQR